MRKTIITCSITALVLTGAFASTAEAQNPFKIENPAIVGDTCVASVCDPDNNSGVAPGAAKQGDPNGSTKELGPLNSNTTKIGVIHSDALPTLDKTNPNAQVDLNAVWTQTKVAADLDVWFYFGWSRDSSSGSGFISIEIQKNPLPAGCAYATATEAQLIANCNPWANRTTNDFILLWDQQGGSRDIYIRKFTGTAPNLVLGPATLLASNIAKAEYSADGFRGEAAVNLSDAGVFTSSGCQTFANSIPGTVTGNSDTADYKDAVLALFPAVSNCGTVIVQKVTNPAGFTGSFPYTLANGGTIFPGSADPICVTSGASTTMCQATLTGHGDSDTIGGLAGATTYTLTETPSSPFTLASIVCTVGADTTTYDGTVAFPVVVSETTTCVITNNAQGGPTGLTVQGSQTTLGDTVNISGILRKPTGGAAETPLKVTFKLYKTNSASGCIAANEVGTAADKLANTDITVTLVDATTTTGSASTAASILVINDEYRWVVSSAGNNYNAGFTTACGSEITNVSVTHTYNQ